MELYVDIRGIEKDVIAEVVTKLHEELNRIAAERKLKIEPAILGQEQPVKLDDDMAELLVEQCVPNRLTFCTWSAAQGTTPCIWPV